MRKGSGKWFFPKARARRRLLRGGNWNNNATNCRVANRNNNNPYNSNNNNGFRLCNAEPARTGILPAEFPGEQNHSPAP
jgi:formylglycine-generating enzyme required for sulfatase activity